MNFRSWEDQVPEEIKRDSVWNSKAYRLALFAADLAWHDSTKLIGDKRTISLADQLLRSTGAISADIEEGYSRGTGRDRARFYEYGLGSAREARGWYYKGRHVLGESVVSHRIGLLAEVIKLLLTMVPDQRGGVLKEDRLAYHAEPPAQTLDHSIDAGDLLNLVPLS
jgi:four helix bundle protein